jgi:hypothetical protein
MAVDEVAMDEATLLEAECTDYEIHVVIRENRLAYRWYRDGYLIAITSFPDFLRRLENIERNTPTW